MDAGRRLVGWHRTSRAGAPMSHEAPCSDGPPRHAALPVRASSPTTRDAVAGSPCGAPAGGGSTDGLIPCAPVDAARRASGRRSALHAAAGAAHCEAWPERGRREGRRRALHAAAGVAQRDGQPERGRRRCGVHRAFGTPKRPPAEARGRHVSHVARYAERRRRGRPAASRYTTRRPLRARRVCSVVSQS